MAKHVFRLTEFGTFYHEGEYVKETDKSVMYQVGARENRLDKMRAIIIVTDDPHAVVKRYKDEIAALEPIVASLRTQLAQAVGKQREQALQAALRA